MKNIYLDDSFYPIINITSNSTRDLTFRINYENKDNRYNFKYQFNSFENFFNFLLRLVLLIPPTLFILYTRFINNELDFPSALLMNVATISLVLFILDVVLYLIYNEEPLMLLTIKSLKKFTINKIKSVIIYKEKELVSVPINFTESMIDYKNQLEYQPYSWK